MQFDVLASGYGLAEAPTIEPAGSLLFSDVLGGGVHRITTAGAVETIVPKRRGIGGIALHAGGGVVCSGRDIVHVRDGETRSVLHVDGVAGWNDLCTDRAGRVYAGSLRFAVFDPEAAEVPGELWRVDGRGDATTCYDGVVHANGVALSLDERSIFHSDTRARAVLVHDLAEDGTATSSRAIDVTSLGHPDGLAVDEAGCMWVALVGGGIGRFTPAGALDRLIRPPSSFVTSLCFAGRDLYVTTGNHDEHPDLRGCVLRATVDVAGAPVFAATV
jgi:gluconolactonase